MTYRVVSGTEDDPVYDWELPDRHFTWSATTFVKRQLRPNEQKLNMRGGKLEYPFNRERLENEHDALQFIAKNTTIPVPKVLDWSVDANGTASLTMETVHGRLMLGLLGTLGEEDKRRLHRNVDAFMYDTVLPQLAKLRSKSLGQLNGVVFPPPRVIACDDRKFWRSSTASTDHYVFCHNDLAQHNIMIDPDTLKVVSLIDWEYAGFFPPEFEFHFWHTSYRERDDANEVEPRRLLAMMDEPGKTSCTCRASRRSHWANHGYRRCSGFRLTIPLLFVFFGNVVSPFVDQDQDLAYLIHCLYKFETYVIVKSWILSSHDEKKNIVPRLPWPQITLVILGSSL